MKNDEEKNPERILKIEFTTWYPPKQWVEYHKSTINKKILEDRNAERAKQGKPPLYTEQKWVEPN